MRWVDGHQCHGPKLQVRWLLPYMKKAILLLDSQKAHIGIAQEVKDHIKENYSVVIHGDLMKVLQTLNIVVTRSFKNKLWKTGCPLAPAASPTHGGYSLLLTLKWVPWEYISALGKLASSSILNPSMKMHLR